MTDWYEDLLTWKHEMDTEAREMAETFADAAEFLLHL